MICLEDIGENVTSYGNYCQEHTESIGNYCRHPNSVTNLTSYSSTKV